LNDLSNSGELECRFSSFDDAAGVVLVFVVSVIFKFSSIWSIKCGWVKCIMPSAFFSMLTPEKSWKSPATVMSSPAALMSSIAFSISFWSGPESYRHIIHTHHLIYQNVGEEFAPKEYKSILTAEQRVKGAKITLLDLESAMNDLFRTLQPLTVPNTDEKEIALVAAFQGKCHYCKRPGHKASECRKKKTEQKGGKLCKHCNQKGHPENMCWELPQNASRRPNG
jgi:hypothetical protein